MPAPSSLRENYRQQLLTSIGGVSGALITAIPTVVFVLVNVVASLWPAVLAAVGSALVLTGYRVVRHQPVQQALSGLFGVVVAAAIAAYTGQARGYFLVGIITSFLYAVPFAVSIVIRRPLVGWLWEFLDPTPSPEGARTPEGGERSDGSESFDAAGGVAGFAPDAPVAAAGAPAPPWYRQRPLLRAYTWSTLAATAVFLARGTVQLVLYGEKATGWLAFARIAMGYPLFVLAVGLSVVLVRRARQQVSAPVPG